MNQKTEQLWNHINYTRIILRIEDSQKKRKTKTTHQISHKISHTI